MTDDSEPLLPQLVPQADERAQPTYESQSPLLSFIILTAALFGSEYLVMFILPLLPRLSPWLHNLLDAGMMVLLAYPALHFLVLRPLRQNLAERRKAEAREQDRTRELLQVVARLEGEVRTRRKAEHRLQNSATVLGLVLTQPSLPAYLEALVRVLQEWCVCQGAGIRLIDAAGRAPFTASIGLSEAFLERENNLRVYEETCACMRRLRGAEPADPQSKGASGAHSRNPSSELPTGPLECTAGKPKRPCFLAGYQSIAHIPLRHGDQLLGSIHLVDSAPGKFGSETVELIEAIAPLISAAYLRFKAEDRLQESEQRFRALFERHQAVMLLIDPERGAVLDANPAAAVFYEQSREELRGRAIGELGLSLAALQSAQACPQPGNGRGKLEISGQFAGQRRIVEIHSSEIRLQGRALLFSILHDVTEHRRMERQILEISENEQQRLGRDLHDGLGQHLTATAFLAKALAMKLTASSNAAATEANHIVECVNRAIGMTRQLARGLCPVDLARNGLKTALSQYAQTSEQLFGVSCRFTAEAELPVLDESGARHCYRIVQEAVSNAVRHGKPQEVEIRLAERDKGVALTVSDNGVGLPEEFRGRRGMGLYTMAFRANALGAHLSVERAPEGGTVVTCLFPKTKFEK